MGCSIGWLRVALSCQMCDPRIHGRRERLTLTVQTSDLPTAHIIITLVRIAVASNQEATARTEFGERDWFNISKEVGQGCSLPPYLFLNRY